jgi:hypothetical protein
MLDAFAESIGLKGYPVFPHLFFSKEMVFLMGLKGRSSAVAMSRSTPHIPNPRIGIHMVAVAGHPCSTTSVFAMVKSI